MEHKEIRLLTADEIDVRVAQTSNYDGVVKVNLLLYKDARVDMKILDEVFGPMNWQRSHQLIGDRLYCTIEVWDSEKGCWIAKQDVGTESNTEPEKGQASDSFKRAGFNFGIGRELYTAPKIQVTLNNKEYADRGGRIQVWATFSVKEIGYDADRNINRLVVVDKSGVIRFDLGAKQTRKSIRKPDPTIIQKADPNTGEVEPLPAIYVSGLTASQYWTMVQSYGDGKKSKTGQDLRQTWIDVACPRPDEVEQFDLDVQDYKAAKQDGVIQ